MTSAKKTYAVKEIFYTLQGEGAHAGRAAVFCRFAGCNLWSGREQDRASAICKFCDTDFIGTEGPDGGRFASPASLADRIAATWPAEAPHAGKEGPHANKDSPHARKFVVCTGGEPLLQLDAPLIEALHSAGFEIAIESNGTLAAPPGIDWICISPKAGAPLVQRTGDELKLVYPQLEPEADPANFAPLAFRHFFLQPMDGPAREANTQRALHYCLTHPQWRLSLQTHKLVGIR
jgi:7-carboxy-7-deazaguanine synthase